MVQAAPLRVNEAGRGLLPTEVILPLNPTCVDWLGANVAFHPRLVAVTVDPCCDQSADQLSWTC